MTGVKRGDGLLMSSRANLTAAMMEAAMTSVDANRSASLCRRTRVGKSLINPNKQEF
jgi:hypothetical protein